MTTQNEQQPVENPVENLLKTQEGNPISSNHEARAIRIPTGTTLHCFRCGYEWKSRRNRLPARCAGCQSYLWFTPKNPDGTILLIGGRHDS